MIKRAGDQRIEFLTEYQGGEGTIEVQHVLESGDYTNPYFDMLLKVTIPPGVSVGMHSHEGITEAVFILSGQALYDDGEERLLHPGDAAVVAESERQSIRSAGDMPMTYMACIVRSPAIE